MALERQVKNHYAKPGLAGEILEAAREKASRPDALSIEDIAPFDELHIGGRRATIHFTARLGIEEGMKVLDIGSGLGGAARYVAHTYEAYVTGIDLTPEYCAAAKTLSAHTGLADRMEFYAGSALAMPFDDHAFDAAYTIHAGMNIADKALLYRESARVLKPGALFGLYDILGGKQGLPLHFPVPWSEGDTSFLASPAEMRRLLENAGFEIMAMEDQRNFALETFARVRAEGHGEHERIRKPGFAQRVENLARNVEEERCSPWEIIVRLA